MLLKTKTAVWQAAHAAEGLAWGGAHRARCSSGEYSATTSVSLPDSCVASALREIMCTRLGANISLPALQYVAALHSWHWRQERDANPSFQPLLARSRRHSGIHNATHKYTHIRKHL